MNATKVKEHCMNELQYREAFFLIEADQTIGLGHFVRALNFMQQSQMIYPDLLFNILVFGDIPLEKLDFAQLNIKDLVHFSSFSCAINYLTKFSKNESNVLGLSVNHSDLPYLFMDISLSEDAELTACLQYLKSNYSIVGFYNKLNGIHEIPFHIHVNPNCFESKESFVNFSNSTLYLLGADFRVFSESIMRETYSLNKQNKSHEKKSVKILLVAGNTDPSNRILQILNNIAEIDKNLSPNDQFEFYVIVPKNKNFESNLFKGEVYKHIKVHFFDDVNQLELIKFYKIVDAAITSVGSTFWELSLFHVPCLLIPGSREESVTACWLNKKNMAQLLLESHEFMNHEHIFNIVGFLISIEKLKFNNFYDVPKVPDGTKHIWMELENYILQK